MSTASGTFTSRELGSAASETFNIEETGAASETFSIEETETREIESFAII